MERRVEATTAPPAALTYDGGMPMAFAGSVATITGLEKRKLVKEGEESKEGAQRKECFPIGEHCPRSYGEGGVGGEDSTPTPTTTTTMSTTTTATTTTNTKLLPPMLTLLPLPPPHRRPVRTEKSFPSTSLQRLEL